MKLKCVPVHQLARRATQSQLSRVSGGLMNMEWMAGNSDAHHLIEVVVVPRNLLRGVKINVQKV